MRDNYRIEELLGKGAYGEVRRCVWKKDMRDTKSSIKDYRAVKILSKAYVTDDEETSWRNEVSCMQQMKHPSIMKMYHFYEDEKRFMLIMELNNGGDLHEYLDK